MSAVTQATQVARKAGTLTEGPMPEGSPGYPVLWAAYQTRDVASCPSRCR